MRRLVVVWWPPIGDRRFGLRMGRSVTTVASLHRIGLPRRFVRQRKLETSVGAGALVENAAEQ
jgi:hypothetical protein